MRSTSLVPVALALLGVACGGPTAPAARHAVAITDIQVPAHAAANDTIWISIIYAVSPCDTGFVVTTEYTTTGVRFAASSVRTSGTCVLYDPATSIYVPPRVYVFLPPHVSPFVARFAEPTGGDSVRTIGS